MAPFMSAAVLLSCSMLLSLTATCTADVNTVFQGIHVEVNNRYATVTHLFEFVNNEDSTDELVFESELAPGMFVHAFRAVLNGHLFEGHTKEQQAAEQEYNDAVGNGHNAVLISQDQDASTFAVQCNLGPGPGALNVTTQQFLARKFGFYELSLFLTTVYGYDASIPVTVSIFDEAGVDGFDTPSLTDTVVSLSYFDIGLDYSDDGLSLNAQFEVQSSDVASVPLNLVLRYTTPRMDDTNQFYVDAAGRFLHIFSRENAVRQLRRRLVIVLDSSGSMSSLSKWDNALTAAQYAIDSLTSRDRVGLVLFDSTVGSTDWRHIRRATDTYRTRLTGWLSRKRADGGTNIDSGLNYALELMKADEADTFADADGEGIFYVNQIVLITDGQGNGVYTDDQVLQRTFETNAELASPASIFAFGITSDTGSSWVSSINYPFLRSVALQNGGFEARLKQSNMLEELADYFDVIGSPVLADVQFAYNALDVSNLTTTSFPALYRGTDLVVAGKVRDDRLLTTNFEACTDISVSGVTFEADVSFDTSFVWDEPAELTPSLSNVWAYLVVKSIAVEVLRPGVTENKVTELEAVAVSEALAHNLVTQWTSMVVVDYGEYEEALQSNESMTTTTTTMVTSAPSAVNVPNSPTQDYSNYRPSPSPSANAYYMAYAPSPGYQYYDEYSDFGYFGDYYDDETSSYYETEVVEPEYHAVTCASRREHSTTTTSTNSAACMCGTSTCESLLDKTAGTWESVDKQFGCTCAACKGATNAATKLPAATEAPLDCDWWECRR